MRSKMIFFAALLSILFSCSQKAPQYQSRAEAIAAQIHDPSSEYVVVVCHRGDWRNFPENSIPAIESVIRMGADMVEVDLKMTADSVLVLSHDATLNRCTNRGGLISELTLAQVKQASLRRGHGEVIDTLHIPTLEEALLVCKDRICVNLDQGYDYYEKALEITEKLGVTDQVLIKGSYDLASVRDHASHYSHNMMYMPVVQLQQDWGKQLFRSYMDQGEVPLAYELCWRSNDDGTFDAACARVREQGSKIWVNTIWASLCGGYGNDDDAAFISGDPGSVYQQYLDKGVSMIQTDRPEMLIGWLTARGRHTLPR